MRVQSQRLAQDGEELLAIALRLVFHPPPDLIVGWQLAAKRNVDDVMVRIVNVLRYPYDVGGCDKPQPRQCVAHRRMRFMDAVQGALRLLEARACQASRTRISGPPRYGEGAVKELDRDAMKLFSHPLCELLLTRLLMPPPFEPEVHSQ